MQVSMRERERERSGGWGVWTHHGGRERIVDMRELLLESHDEGLEEVEEEGAAIPRRKPLRALSLEPILVQ